MNSSSNGTSFPYKSKVEGGVVDSRPTRCNLTYQSKWIKKIKIKIKEGGGGGENNTHQLSL